MNIGIPKESKEGERRVALLPSAVAALVAALGASVLVESAAGIAVGGCDDDAYRSAGARSRRRRRGLARGPGGQGEGGPGRGPRAHLPARRRALFLPAPSRRARAHAARWPLGT
jgi:hypothetical protein